MSHKTSLETFKLACKYFFGSPYYILWGLCLFLQAIKEITIEGWNSNLPGVVLGYSIFSWLATVISMIVISYPEKAADHFSVYYLWAPLVFIVFVLFWAITHQIQNESEGN